MQGQTAVIFGLLLCLVLEVNASPIKSSTRRHRTDEREPCRKPIKHKWWWSSPCGYSLDEPCADRLYVKSSSEKRHSSSALKKLMAGWVEMLKMANQDINLLSGDFPLKQVLWDTKVSYPWLDSNSTEVSIENFNKKEITSATRDLYTKLQRFAITIECLTHGDVCKMQFKKFNITQPKINESEQDLKNLHSVKSSLKQLLCEVQSFLRKVNPIKSLPRTVKISQIDRLWLKEMKDSTAQHVHKTKFIQRYMEYIGRWKKNATMLLKNAKQKNTKSKKY